MDNLTKFRDAVMGAQGVNVPGAGTSPIATPTVQPQIQNLQNLARSGFQLDASGAASNALTGQAGATADQEAADQKARAQELADKMAEIDKKRKDLADPSKYQKIINSAGGYDFYDPEGNKIDVRQYAQVAGKHVTDVLSDSQDVNDQNFTGDYKNVKELGHIFQTGDKKALDKLYEKDPGLKDYLKGKTYADVVQDFRQNYKQYFESVLPNSSEQTNKTMLEPQGGGSLLDKFKSLFS